MFFYFTVILLHTLVEVVKHQRLITSFLLLLHLHGEERYSAPLKLRPYGAIQIWLLFNTIIRTMYFANTIVFCNWTVFVYCLFACLYFSLFFVFFWLPLVVNTVVLKDAAATSEWFIFNSWLLCPFLPSHTCSCKSGDLKTIKTGLLIRRRRDSIRNYSRPASLARLPWRRRALLAGQFNASPADCHTPLNDG